MKVSSLQINFPDVYIAHISILSCSFGDTRRAIENCLFKLHKTILDK